MHDGTLVFGPVRGWNGRLNGMDEDVEVDVMVSRDGDHRGVLCDGPLEERFDLGVRLHGPFFGNQVDFVLNDDDVLNACDLKGHQVFPGLRLRTGFVGGHHQHGTVHDGGTRDHDGHQRLVAGSIDKGHDPFQLCLNIIATVGSLARGVVLAVFVLVERRVGVPEFDGNTALSLLGMGIGPHARKRLRQRGFSVVNVAD